MKLNINPTFLLTGLIGLSGCNTESGTSHTDSPESMNVILILTDDQGYGDIGAHGNENINTPYLDRLYSESIRFSNFHSGTTCAPTRASLMSGMYHNKTGTWHTVSGRSFLDSQYPTIADYFSESNYRTGIFGKWHLGDNYPYRPQDRGFEEVLIHGGGGIGQVPDYWGNDYFGDTYFHNGKPEKFEGYCTDIWVEKAIQFILETKQENRPFFCYLSLNAPHGPHHVPQEYIDMYAGNPEIPLPSFYGQITHLDEKLAKLDSMLGVSGLDKNTLLIFMTDNGTARGVDLDKQGHVRLGFNAGMRGKKGSEYEGGHRVPLFMKFPPHLNFSPVEYSQLLSVEDILPTLLDILNIAVKTQKEPDGKSFYPLIRNGKQESLEDRILVVDTQRKLNLIRGKNSCVMQGKWRLINQKELYNLETDPAQFNDLSYEFPEKTKTLSKAYNQWWEKLMNSSPWDNRISIRKENPDPVLLSCHDWRTEKLPPWDQVHIRNAKKMNGSWPLYFEHTGRYSFRLYRYPPWVKAQFSDDLAAEKPVPGGHGSPVAQGLYLKEARLIIQEKEYKNNKPTSKQFFEFNVDIKAGNANLLTILEEFNGEERGAYYVTIQASGLKSTGENNE